MDRIRKLVNNIFYFLSSNLMGFTLGFISSILLARTLGPNQLGVFHGVQYFSTVFSVLLSLGFITCIVKFTAQFKARGDRKNIVAMIRYIFYIELFITAFSTICLIALSVPISDFFFSPKESRLFLIMFLGITPGMQTAILCAYLEGEQIFKYQTIHALSIAPLNLIFKIVLLLMGFGVEALIWITVSFSIVNLIFYFFAVNREKLFDGWRNSKLSPDIKSELNIYNSSVFSIEVINQIVWARSENFFLGRFCSAEQLGYYNLAHNLVLKLTGTLNALLWRILLPLSAEHEGEDNIDRRQRTYQHAIRYSSFIIFPIITICLVCAYELIIVLYGQEYASVESCFQVLCIGTLITSLATPGSAIIYAANRQQFIFWYGAILAVLNIGMDFWLIPPLGALGAAICYTTVTVLGTFGGFIFLKRQMNLVPPWFSLLKISFTCLCLAFVLFLLIRQNTDYFNLFPSLPSFLFRLTGHAFESLIGPRAIRLVFSICAGCSLYLLLALILFKPGKDDFKILLSLEAYLPQSVLKFIIKWKQN